ncbi:LPS-assembly protein LptD [Sandaracinobacteroides saxicola]|uniref:LPS-assembly protein LptD n=2 Tax=Sandaracinobacteroides saxicola TaxID=2759707 RepID=A0A7G5IJM9_9SPHN|nr:LPS-assembly protein LptD [Sandaracinobacteroides saxicola]
MMRPLFLSLLLACASPGFSQDAPPPAANQAEEIEFSANLLTYDENADLVTATGDVILTRDGTRLTADRVRWERKTGLVEADGRVLIVDPSGNRVVGDRIALTDSLKDGFVSNILLVLEDGSRLAAVDGVRKDEVTTLNRAVYSPCAVVDANGCPLRPVWQIKALRIVHDPARGLVSYQKARLEMFGIPLVALPGLSHPDNFDRNRSGLLGPDVRFNRFLGAEVSLPYFISFAPNRDLTLTPFLYTGVNPVLGASYRHLFDAGPIEIGGRITWARGQTLAPDGVSLLDTANRIRGNLDIKGQLNHGDGWRSTFSSRLATDDNFLGRYQISYDDRLRSTWNLEHFGGQSYLSVQGWAFQGLRATDRADTTPLALPLVDFRWRLPLQPLGGALMLHVNSLNIHRAAGQDMTRALASLQWDRSWLSTAGQRLTLTALVRGDVYNTRNGELADLPLYAGENGWKARAIPLVAADIEWPLAGALWGGTQTLTPHIQFVASRAGVNSGIPNEDARAIDLEDINLFSLNRFPGFDRWEGGARITYGATWTWNAPGLAASAQLGQSYRFSSEGNLYPDGTGLSNRFSDLVGRFNIRIGRWVELSQRVRIDNENLAIRRNETDVTFGTRSTYATVGYFKYNRNINLEDLRDHEELRLGGRLPVGRFWAVYGAIIVDLTSRADDPLTVNDGFQPIRHRVGVTYLDDCLEFGLSWRRDYVSNINIRRGNSFLFTLSLKNLGI